MAFEQIFLDAFASAAVSLYPTALADTCEGCFFRGNAGLHTCQPLSPADGLARCLDRLISLTPHSDVTYIFFFTVGLEGMDADDACDWLAARDRFDDLLRDDALHVELFHLVWLALREED